MWPRHGISYAKGANDIAALVTRNTDNELHARLYAFRDQAHDLQLRVWRLRPGTYKVTLATDPNNDVVDLASSFAALRRLFSTSFDGCFSLASVMLSFFPPNEANVAFELICRFSESFPTLAKLCWVY